MPIQIFEFPALLPWLPIIQLRSWSRLFKHHFSLNNWIQTLHFKCRKHIKRFDTRNKHGFDGITAISLLAAILNDVTRLRETAISDVTAVN